MGIYRALLVCSQYIIFIFILQHVLISSIAVMIPIAIEIVLDYYSKVGLVY